MRVLVTGANGWVGATVARDLIAKGHEVVGLVRSPDTAAAVAAFGVTPLIGTIGDLTLLRAAAATADGIIHTAFGTDFAKIVEMAAEDRAALEAFAEVFGGSARPIVVTAGFGLSSAAAPFDEDSRPPVMPDFPRASEQTAFALAARGINARVVRLPRSVHGRGERHGFVPGLAAIARARGVSAYVDAGANLWPSVHRLDAARVFCLALEHDGGDLAFHAVAEEGVPFRLIAEAIGRQVGVSAAALTPEAAASHFGPLVSWVAGNGPASSARTRAVLGWTPREVGLVADIEQPDYSH